MKKTNTNNIELLKIKALVYGGSGSGKTTTIKTLPEDKTLLVLLEGDVGKLPLIGTNYETVEVENWEDAISVLKKLETCVETQKKYDNIFFDGITELSLRLKEHILSDKKYELMQIGDWYSYSEKIMWYIRRLRDLPYNVFATCLDHRDKDEDTGRFVILPGISGSVKSLIGSPMNLVFYLTKSEKITDGKRDQKRFFLTEWDTKYPVIKDQTTVLDKHEIADWSKIIGKIKKELGGKK